MNIIRNLICVLAGFAISTLAMPAIAANTDSGGWQGLSPLEGLSEEDATSARFVWQKEENIEKRLCRLRSFGKCAIRLTSLIRAAPLEDNWL